MKTDTHPHRVTAHANTDFAPSVNEGNTECNAGAAAYCLL